MSSCSRSAFRLSFNRLHEFAEARLVFLLESLLVLSVEAEIALPASDLVFAELFFVFEVLLVLPYQVSFALQGFNCVGPKCPVSHFL